jgi:hypothetical protein
MNLTESVRKFWKIQLDGVPEEEQSKFYDLVFVAEIAINSNVGHLLRDFRTHFFEPFADYVPGGYVIYWPLVRKFVESNDGLGLSIITPSMDEIEKRINGLHYELCAWNKARGRRYLRDMWKDGKRSLKQVLVSNLRSELENLDFTMGEIEIPVIQLLKTPELDCRLDYFKASLGNGGLSTCASFIFYKNVPTGMGVHLDFKGEDFPSDIIRFRRAIIREFKKIINVNYPEINKQWI